VRRAKAAARCAVRSLSRKWGLSGNRAGRRQTREQLRARRVVEHAADISAVGAFAARHGLPVVSAEPNEVAARYNFPVHATGGGDVHLVSIAAAP